MEELQHCLHKDLWTLKKKKQNKPYDMCIAISEVYSA